ATQTRRGAAVECPAGRRVAARRAAQRPGRRGGGAISGAGRRLYCRRRHCGHCLAPTVRRARTNKAASRRLRAVRIVAAPLGRDVERGFFDQLYLRGIAEEVVVAVRLLAHWLSFGPPLMLATLPAAALLGLDSETLRTVELGLLAGTPGLAAIGLIIAALTIGMRGGAALAGLLLIPLAVPLLVFGAGALATGGSGGIALAAAISLLLV